MTWEKPIVILNNKKTKKQFCKDNVYFTCLLYLHPPTSSQSENGYQTNSNELTKHPHAGFTNTITSINNSHSRNIWIQNCELNPSVPDNSSAAATDNGNSRELESNGNTICDTPVIVMDFYLAWCCLYELANSCTFRTSFLSMLSSFIHWKEDVKTIVLAVSHPSYYIIDLLWGRCLNCLLYQRHAIEEASAWLSTLGGGYSSLGDYFHHHAATAGKISLKQWTLAVQLGDKGLEARCKLFLSQSLMQQGNLRQAKKLIRQQFSVASRAKDDRLILICKAMWIKLKYLYNQRRVKVL